MTLGKLAAHPGELSWALLPLFGQGPVAGVSECSALGHLPHLFWPGLREVELLASVHTKCLEAELALGPRGQMSAFQAGSGGWSPRGENPPCPLSFGALASSACEGTEEPQTLGPDALEEPSLVYGSCVDRCLGAQDRWWWTMATILGCRGPGLKLPAGSKTEEMLLKSGQSANLESSGFDQLPPGFANLTGNWVRSV